MRDSFNYSNFVDLLLESDDDYEPYGLSTPNMMHGAAADQTRGASVQIPLYVEDLDPWRGK